jgi:hypothetical protein
MRRGRVQSGHLCELLEAHGLRMLREHVEQRAHALYDLYGAFGVAGHGQLPYWDARFYIASAPWPGAAPALC